MTCKPGHSDSNSVPKPGELFEGKGPREGAETNSGARGSDLAEGKVTRMQAEGLTGTRVVPPVTSRTPHLVLLLSLPGSSFLPFSYSFWSSRPVAATPGWWWQSQRETPHGKLWDPSPTQGLQISRDGSREDALWKLTCRLQVLWPTQLWELSLATQEHFRAAPPAFSHQMTLGSKVV